MAILKDTFYRVIEKSEETERSIHLGIALKPEHPIFKGHFPDNPVTPGACMVQMVKELVADQLGKKVRMSEARQIKFLDVLVPDPSARLEVLLEIDTAGPIDVPVKAQLFDEKHTYLKFSGNFIFDN